MSVDALKPCNHCVVVHLTEVATNLFFWLMLGIRWPDSIKSEANTKQFRQIVKLENQQRICISYSMLLFLSCKTQENKNTIQKLRTVFLVAPILIHPVLPICRLLIQSVVVVLQIQSYKTHLVRNFQTKSHANWQELILRNTIWKVQRMKVAVSSSMKVASVCKWFEFFVVFSHLYFTGWEQCGCLLTISQKNDFWLPTNGRLSRLGVSNSNCLEGQMKTCKLTRGPQYTIKYK